MRLGLGFNHMSTLLPQFHNDAILAAFVCCWGALGASGGADCNITGLEVSLDEEVSPKNRRGPLISVCNA